MPRKEKGLVEQNIELSAEFSRYLFDHPEIDEAIPLDTEIILLPEFNAELRNFNFKLGSQLGYRKQSCLHEDQKAQTENIISNRRR
jgi:hypothetical protein